MKIEQQKNILNAIANDLGLLKQLNRGTHKISREDFSKENQQVFDGLLQLRNSNFKNANTQSLELVGVNFTVINLTEAEARVTLKNEMFQWNQQQALISAKQIANKMLIKAQEALAANDANQAEKIIAELGTHAQQYKKMANNANSQTTIEITKNLQFDENRGVIPTYIPEIDCQINGGFERSNINVISATPHNGKTTFGVEAASNQALNNFRVLYLSLEQIKENINQSVLGFVSETVLHMDDEIKKSIFGTKAPKGNFDKPFWDATKFVDWNDTNEKKALGIKILENTVMDFLEIEDETFQDVNEILARITLASEEGFDIVYIDNFQNLKYTGERTQAFEKFSEGLLDIAKETGIAVVALSQLTMDNKGNVKTKYASKLNDDASNHLKITRVKKDEEEDIPTPDMIEVYVEKTRRGQGFDAKILLPFLGAKGVIGSVHIPKRTPAENKKRKEDFKAREMVGGFKIGGQEEQQDGLPF